MSSADFVLMIDLLGTFAFALNGAFTATRTVRLDIVGVLILGVTTAIGGGIMRDVLVGVQSRRARSLIGTIWRRRAAGRCLPSSSVGHRVC